MPQNKPIFRLNKAEIDSSFWRKLVEHFEDVIEERRDQLEVGSNMDERARGAIEVLRQLIDLSTNRET